MRLAQLLRLHGLQFCEAWRFHCALYHGSLVCSSSSRSNCNAWPLALDSGLIVLDPIIEGAGSLKRIRQMIAGPLEFVSVLGSRQPSRIQNIFNFSHEAILSQSPEPSEVWEVQPSLSMLGLCTAITTKPLLLKPKPPCLI